MSIYPTLRYDDPRAVMAFLTSALGLVEQAVHTADDGNIWSFGTYRPQVKP